MAEVYDGILNEENPMVCVQVRPDIQKEKIRRVQVGDVLGRLYSVVDDRKDLDGNMVTVVSGDRDEWKFERMYKGW